MIVLSYTNPVQENPNFYVAIHKRTFEVKFDMAKWNFSLVFVPAACPAFAILPKAPFSQAALAVTYLFNAKIE